MHVVRVRVRCFVAGFELRLGFAGCMRLIAGLGLRFRVAFRLGLRADLHSYMRVESESVYVATCQDDIQVPRLVVRIGRQGQG